MYNQVLLTSFIEMCVFYDHLIKLIHELQNLVNDREKEKLDMLTEIDILLKKISSYYMISEKWERQAVTYKRETALKQNLVDRYKQQQTCLIEKIVKLHNMNWNLAQAFQHITGKKIVTEKPKNPEPLDPNRVLSLRSLPSLKIIEDQNSVQIHNLAETNLIDATVSVFNFFFKRAQPTYLDIEVRSEQTVVQQLLQQLSSSEYSQYKFKESCQSLEQCLKTVSQSQVQYMQFLKSLKDMPRNTERIDWSQFSIDMNILAEAYDRRVKIDHYRYRYWNESCCLLQELRFKTSGDLKQKVERILLKSELFCRIIKESVDGTVAFQDCILRYRMLSEHMKKGTGLTDADKEQKYIPKLRDNVLHEKQLMNQLAKALQENRRKFGTNRLIFEENLKQINGKFDHMITTIREKEAKIELLQKDVEQKGRRSMMMDMSLIDGDTSMAARRSRRRRKNLAVVSEILSIHWRSVMYQSGFSFMMEPQKSKSNSDSKSEPISEPKSEPISETKSDPKIQPVNQKKTIEDLVAELNGTINKIQEQDQKLKSIANQIQEMSTAEEGKTSRQPIIVNNEEVTDIKQLVFESFKVYKRVEESRRFESEPFPEDISPVPQANIQKSFEQYVGDDNYSVGFFQGSNIYQMEKQQKLFAKPPMNKFQRQDYNKLSKFSLAISGKQLEIQQLKEQFEKKSAQQRRVHESQIARLKRIHDDLTKQQNETINSLKSTIQILKESEKSLLKQIEQLKSKQQQNITFSLIEAPKQQENNQKQTDSPTFKQPQQAIPQKQQPQEIFRITVRNQIGTQTDRNLHSQQSIVFEFTEDQSKTRREQSSAIIPQDTHHLAIQKVVSPVLAGADFDLSVDKHHLGQLMNGLSPLPSRHGIEELNEQLHESRDKIQFQSGFTIEQLHDLRKVKVSQIYEIQRKMLALTEQKALKEHQALSRDSCSQGDIAIMLLGKAFQSNLSRELKLPNIDEFITMKMSDDSNTPSKIRQLEQTIEVLERYKKDIEWREHQKDQLILMQEKQISKYQEQIKKLEVTEHENMKELRSLRENDKQIEILKINTVQLEEELRNLKNSNTSEEEIKALRNRLQDLQELDSANRALKIEVHDYQHRMMEYSTKLANLQIKLKQLTEQLEEFQRKNKQRIVKQQEWLRLILENPGFLPLNPDINKQFLKMVFMMQQKIISQEKEIRDMMQEFEIDKKEQAESIMKMKDKLLASLPDLPLD